MCGSREETPLSITILGPERPAPVLPRVLDRLGIRGPVALVTAGWRHDEPRDEPLRDAVGIEVRNLALYAAFRALERDAPDLIAAYTHKQAVLRRTKERYRAAIVPALNGCRDLYARRRDATCPWFGQAMRNIQAMDEIFLAECDRLHRSFEDEHHPARHPRVQAEIDRIRETLEGTAAVLIAGGHVGVLRNRLSFFGFDEWLRGRTLVAWSAGAMTLTERIVLFHDHTTFGVGLAEVLDRGMGLLPDVVFLPHAKERLDLGDAENVAILARRFAPAACVGLQNGATLEGPRLASTGLRDAAFTLRVDGTLAPVEEVHAPAA